MTTANSTASGRPAKPYPEYPLFPHSNGSWAKKIRGTLHYFGSWKTDTPDRGADAALEKYLRDRDDLHAERTPRTEPAAVAVKDCCNAFLNHKADKRDAGELSVRTWQEAKEACDLCVFLFGRTRLVSDLRPDDFERLRSAMAKRWGPVRLGNVIHRVKSVFKYALESGLIDKPVLYGPTFRRPSAGVLRRHRAKNGEKMLEAGQLRKLLAAADVHLRAMILLGLNCGYGNHDVAALPRGNLDLDNGIVDFPRPKTGLARRCPLWPETVAALRESLAARPRPKNEADADLVFLTVRGTAWLRETENSRTDNVSVHFANAMKAASIQQNGFGFYGLRHVHRTIADEARDPVACDLIMGHSDPSMGARYRERIDDARLKAVTDHVRNWLFGERYS